MSKSTLVDLFAEDRAHEELLKPLIIRVGREKRVDMRVSVRIARGGHSRAIN